MTALPVAFIIILTVVTPNKIIEKTMTFWPGAGYQDLAHCLDDLARMKELKPKKNIQAFWRCEQQR